MEDYHFGADLLDAYRATADWVKAVWIVSLAALALGMVIIVLKYRVAVAQIHARAETAIRVEKDLAQRFRRVLSGRAETR